MDFNTYYNTRFKEDLNKFFSTIPDQSRFHEDISNKKIYSIQYDRLGKNSGHLDFLSDGEKINFGIALFFTVLVDMVCYTHFKNNYYEFKNLTLYPKFIGMCPGGCHYHYPPVAIFKALNNADNSKIKNFKRLNFEDKYNEALPLMEKEIKSFFKDHLKEINEVSFWENCRPELPYILQLM